MKVVYEFNLPEDNEDLEIYAHSQEIYKSSEEIRQFVRSQLKHGINMEAEQILLHIRELLPEVTI